MRQSLMACFLGVMILALGGASAAEAGDFTIGVKAWDASLSSDGLDGSNDLFPGIYFSWSINDSWSISGGYIEGEVDFTTDLGASGTIEEVDSDLIVRWRWTKRLEIGAGYRQAEFTTVLNEGSFPVKSSGPTAYIGGGALFGQSRHWGYYWGAAYMFEDIDDDDGSQEHFNGEGGLQWTAKNFSVLVGYRYKKYTGDGTDFTFDGPVVNLAYSWR